jgi:hypothetical protein
MKLDHPGSPTKPDRPHPCRGQANLIALGAALLALTVAAGLGLTLADAALAGTDRQPLQRAAADGAADRLVAADAHTTRRANVLNESAIEALTVPRLEAMAPAIEGRDVRVRVGERTILRRGDPSDGVTIRRIVLVAEETTETRTVDLDESETTTLPRRTDRIRLAIEPAPNTTVVTVRVDERIVLHDPNGISGTVTVPVSRYETTTVAFETRRDGVTDAEGDDDVAITYYPTQASKAVLEVSVGD